MSDYDDGKAWDTQSIDTKCQFLEDQLKLIKPEILNESVLCFYGNVDDTDSSRFSDHSEFLNYLSDLILPICDKTCEFEFIIGLYSDKSAGKCVLTSLLKMAQIKCCSYVQIRIYDADQMKLPVKEISNWLHGNCDSHRIRKRSLLIYLGPIENLTEMFNHLKEVIVSF